MYTVNIDLCVESVVITATYPFLFTCICNIAPSIVLLHKYVLSNIKHISLPLLSAIAKYLLLESNMAVFIFTAILVTSSP